jgi:hypothetical protein
VRSFVQEPINSDHAVIHATNRAMDFKRASTVGLSLSTAENTSPYGVDGMGEKGYASKSPNNHFAVCDYLLVRSYALTHAKKYEKSLR